MTNLIVLKSQTGQATIEFIVACLVMIPLFFGIYYFARYSDIKQAAIQGSRYAAFERALDPSSVKSDAVIAEEVRARFFSEQSKINYHDTTATGAAKFLWVTVDNKKLIENYTDIKNRFDSSLRFTSGPIMDKLDSLGGTAFNLPRGHIIKSEVNVPLVNIAHFDILRNINITLPAATAIGSGTWNASGSKGDNNSTCVKVKRAVVSDYANGINSLLNFGMDSFENANLEFGIVLPDYVPPGSLRRNNSSTPSSTSLNEQKISAVKC